MRNAILIAAMLGIVACSETEANVPVAAVTGAAAVDHTALATCVWRSLPSGFQARAIAEAERVGAGGAPNLSYDDYLQLSQRCPGLADMDTRAAAGYLVNVVELEALSRVIEAKTGIDRAGLLRAIDTAPVELRNAQLAVAEAVVRGERQVRGLEDLPVMEHVLSELNLPPLAFPLRAETGYVVGFVGIEFQMRAQLGEEHWYQPATLEQ